MGRWATFDCYGTLIDWEGGIADTLHDLWPTADRGDLLARYHRLEPEVQAGSAMPYREVMAEVQERIGSELGDPVAADRRYALAESLPGWSPFPEVPVELRELQGRGWRIGILSNTDPDLLAASIERLGIRPDVTITAREAGSYKPALGHWMRFREVSGIDGSEDRHAHVAASLFHDIAPAADLGIPAVWINRLGESSDLPRAAELPNLSGLPDVLDRVVA
jgi:2-haloacid dehalogenase